MKKVTLSYPTKPKKQDPQCCDKDGNPDTDMFKMAMFAWEEDYKSMKSRMDNTGTINQMHGHLSTINDCPNSRTSSRALVGTMGPRVPTMWQSF
jgi:hypothetical protein